MLKPFMKKHGWRYIPGAIFLILCTFINTRAPIVLGAAVDLLEEAVNGSVTFASFVPVALRILWIALSVFATRFIWRYFIIGNSRELEIWLRDQLYDHLQKLPVSFYGRHRSGDMMAYAINDVNSVRMIMGMVLSQSLNAATSIGFSIASMVQGINGRLTFLALIPIPIAIFLIIWIGRSVQRKSRRVQEMFQNISGHVQENINGMRVLKAFAQEKAQNETFAVESGDMRKANIDLNDTSALTQPIMKLLFGISYVVGILYGGNLVLRGEMSVGDYVAFNTYLGMIVNPVNSIGRIVNMLQRGMASYKRLKTLFDEPEIPEFERRDDPTPVEGHITAKKLTFTHDDGNTPAVEDVSFDLPAGHMLGLVGPTGSGKSTVLQLLLKILPVTRGQLFLDGRDICDIPAAALRNACGYVPQDGFLFNVSIKENVSFFSNASDAEIRNALEIAGMTQDIEAMPEQLETVCGERGNHLSGGQRQRTSLARALVRKPAVLLLDDTLSAVDTATEGRILNALKSEFKGRTVIVIAHRLSAVRDADEILYMDHGRVIERGTHSELLALNGEYAHVFHEQQKNAEEVHSA